MITRFLDSGSVVYRSFPTSNHNTTTDNTTIGELYIVRFLHQTTTVLCFSRSGICCISFVSYIKPQRSYCSKQWYYVVYRSFPTSNHNNFFIFPYSLEVVYRSFPTSNHNLGVNRAKFNVLYIVRFLHQTTTLLTITFGVPQLYIVRFLHQTTTQ